MPGKIWWLCPPTTNITQILVVGGIHNLSLINEACLRVSIVLKTHRKNVPFKGRPYTVLRLDPAEINESYCGIGHGVFRTKPGPCPKMNNYIIPYARPHN